MASLEFADMDDNELQTTIKDLQTSLTTIERGIKDQIHAIRVFCRSTSVKGESPAKDEAKYELRNLKKQQKLLSAELQRARAHLRCRQMHGE